MSSVLIKKDMEMFQRSVRKLSTEIGRASSIWTDSKFSELSASVSTIANMSKDVIVASERCCSSADRFEKIGNEKY